MDSAEGFPVKTLQISPMEVKLWESRQNAELTLRTAF